MYFYKKVQMRIHSIHIFLNECLDIKNAVFQLMLRKWLNQNSMVFVSIAKRFKFQLDVCNGYHNS